MVVTTRPGNSSVHPGLADIDKTIKRRPAAQVLREKEAKAKKSLMQEEAKAAGLQRVADAEDKILERQTAASSGRRHPVAQVAVKPVPRRKFKPAGHIIMEPAPKDANGEHVDV